MSAVSDEVYDGTRCAICEERFKPGEAQRGVPQTAERVHTSCWEGGGEAAAIIAAAYGALAEQYRQLGPPPAAEGGAMSTETGVRDSRGNPLTEGARVEAWRDGQRYMATVREIEPHHLGDGDFRHLVLVRESDHAETRSFSDAVRVIPAHLWPCGCLRNDAGAHRVGCPDHPEGVRG